jgi:hypothetical protein
LQSQIGGISGLKDLLLYINEEDPVQKAFELMQKYNVHGIPVLDKEGKLVGNISVSDMRVIYIVKWSHIMKHIVKWEIAALSNSAKDFFAQVSQLGFCVNLRLAQSRPNSSCNLQKHNEAYRRDQSIGCYESA